MDNLPNQPFNNEHISFQARNGNWLAAELDANQPGNSYPVLVDCNFACSSSDNGISGPSQFCTGTITYAVPAGADTYQWQIFSDPVPFTDAPLTGNVILAAANNPNTVNVTHTGNRSGWYTLQVTIDSNACDVQNLVVTKRIYIGAPTVGTLTVAGNPGGAHLNAFSAPYYCEVPLRLDFDPNNAEVTDIEWEKISTDVAWSRDYGNYGDRYVYVYPTCNKAFKFKVRAKNSCGFWSPWREFTYDVTECLTSCQSPGGNIVSDNFNLYPVPANTVLNFAVVENPTWDFPSSSPFVNLNDINTDPNGSIVVTYPRVKLFVSFYNNIGNVIYSTLVSGLPNQLDVSTIPTGTYIMAIEYLGQIETHNIVIQ